MPRSPRRRTRGVRTYRPRRVPPYTTRPLPHASDGRELRTCGCRAWPTWSPGLGHRHQSGCRDAAGLPGACKRSLLVLAQNGGGDCLTGDTKNPRPKTAAQWRRTLCRNNKKRTPNIVTRKQNASVMSDRRRTTCMHICFRTYIQ
jgi:hypothetical protein